MTAPGTFDGARSVAYRSTEMASEWGSIFLKPLENLTGEVLGFLPQLFSALVILIIGGIIVRILVGLLKKALKKAKIETFFEKIGITKELNNIGVSLTFTDILTTVVHIFLKLIVWIAVIDVLQIDQLTQFIDGITAYIPNVIVAIIILAAGLALSRVVQGLCEGATTSLVSKDHAELLGKITKVAIVAFSVMASLEQLNIASSFIETFFTGIIAALSLALGIAFGLGGKEKAAQTLEKIGK